MSVFIQVEGSIGNDLVINLDQVTRFYRTFGDENTTIAMTDGDKFKTATPFEVFKQLVHAACYGEPERAAFWHATTEVEA